MAYITTTQLSARLGSTLYARLTDRVSGASADSAVAQQIVDEAEGVANSYLSRRYATPIDLTAHPELAGTLEARVLDLAESIAWRSSPFVTDVPDRIRYLFDDAERWLERVASGRLNLPADSPPASRTAEDDGPRFEAGGRAFTGDELDGL